MDVKNFSKFDRLAKKIISTTKRNIFFLPKTTRMQHNFLQNVRQIIAISFDKSNGTFVRLGRCSRLILKYVFCWTWMMAVKYLWKHVPILDNVLLSCSWMTRNFSMKKPCLMAKCY
jgi:hypothetical protein